MLKFRKKNAFTLVEIIVTLAIVGTLAAIAYPRFMVTLEKMKAKEAEQNLIALLSSQKRYSLENGGTYANALADLDVEIRTLNEFGAPTITSNAAELATFTRNAGSSFGTYSLTIDNTGIISCSGGAAGACTQLGY